MLCCSRAAQTVDTHRNMHAFLALAVALAAPALAAPQDRGGYEREIDTSYNQVPKLLDYELNKAYLAQQKISPKLITKQKLGDVVAADNVILESNVLKIVIPPKPEELKEEEGSELVRRRRGYNLENVRVPARYPYLPIPRFNRFRRMGYWSH